MRIGELLIPTTSHTSLEDSLLHLRLTACRYQRCLRQRTSTQWALVLLRNKAVSTKAVFLLADHQFTSYIFPRFEVEIQSNTPQHD